MTERRVFAARGIALVVIAGLVVALGLPDTPVTDVTGDALYVAAVYLLVVLVAAHRHPLVVGVVTAAWCVAVELFQLTGLPEVWGTAFWPIMLVFGTVFDARDLLVYTVTAGVLVAGDVVLSGLSGASREDAP